LAAPIAMELGAPAGEAAGVLIWLSGAGEVPEEHGPWLSRLASQNKGLRVIALRPKVGFKWYDRSDAECIQLGLRYAVADDAEANPGGDPAHASGDPLFPALEQAEIEALQQVEGAALGVARRCVLEEKSLAVPRAASSSSPLPFFLGGFGQGGAVALYTAICLLQAPVQGVAFSHSGVPVASMLGKRMTERVKQTTSLFALYDRADKEVPPEYPEALLKMLRLVGCYCHLDWLEQGNGHDFFDDAAARVCERMSDCMRSSMRKQMEAEASRRIKESMAEGTPLNDAMLQAVQEAEQDKARQSVKPAEQRFRWKPIWDREDEH